MKRSRESKPMVVEALLNKKQKLPPPPPKESTKVDILPVLQNSFSGMRKFKLKKQAAEDARKRGLYIVAYDVTTNFCKAFLTCTAEELFYMVALQQTQYIHLTALPGGWQNAYEGLLWERPCIPFFDLDAEVQYNKGILKRIDEITFNFMEFVTQFLKKSYPKNKAVQDIQCPNDWIVLDSSYRKKASRHLLLRKEGIEFQTMQDHSRFSVDLLQELRQKALIQKDKQALSLYVKKQDKNKPVELCPIADASVYSVFQLMRMFLCSKRTQHRPLLVAAGFPEHPSVRECFEKNNGPYSNRPTRRLFFDCLISHVSNTLPHAERLAYKRTKIVKTHLNALVTTTTKATNVTVTTTTSDGESLKVHFSPSDVTTDVALESSDWRCYALLSILKQEPHLKGWMMTTTSNLADFKMCPTSSTKNGDTIYIVSPKQTKFCPLKNSDHSSRGKVWITIPPSGRMKLKCKSAACHGKYNDLKKTGFLLKRLDAKQIRHLWPNKT